MLFRLFVLITALISMILMILIALKDYFSLPEVYQSIRTGQCEYIIFNDGSKGDCKSMPFKYKFYYVP